MRYSSLCSWRRELPLTTCHCPLTKGILHSLMRSHVRPLLRYCPWVADNLP